MGQVSLGDNMELRGMWSTEVTCTNIMSTFEFSKSKQKLSYTLIQMYVSYNVTDCVS